MKICPHANIVTLIEKAETRTPHLDLDVMMIFELCTGISNLS